MSTIYRSPKACLFRDSRGFLELFPTEGIDFDGNDIQEIIQAVIAAGITGTSLLISRINRYGVPKDFNLLSYTSSHSIRFHKIAFFAPSPTDRTFSQVMKDTAYRGIPCEIFSDRESAIHWILDSNAEQGAAANP